jgi:hypothetical protein
MTTVVTVNKIDEPKEQLLKTEELQKGDWYEVVSYPHSPHSTRFDGMIGVCIGKWCYNTGDYVATELATTGGHIISHPDFKFRPVKTLKIDYET